MQTSVGQWNDEEGYQAYEKGYQTSPATPSTLGSRVKETNSETESESEHV
jgi:hypothetical protein